MKKVWLLLFITPCLFAVPNDAVRVTSKNLVRYTSRTLCYQYRAGDVAGWYVGGRVLSIFVRRNQETLELASVQWGNQTTSARTCQEANRRSAPYINFEGFLSDLDTVENNDLTYVLAGNRVLCQRPSLRITHDPDDFPPSAELPATEATARRFVASRSLLQTVVPCDE